MPSGTIKQACDNAKEIINNNTKGIKSSWKVSNNEVKISPNGKKLFFKIYEDEPEPKPDPKAVKVAIWSYNDRILQSEQKALLSYSQHKEYQAVFHLSENKVVRLEQDGDRRAGYLNMSDTDVNYLLTESDVEYSEASRLLSEKTRFLFGEYK